MLSRPPISMPSFAQGFARNASESQHPALWKKAVGLWVPFLGNQDSILRDWSGNKNDGNLTGVMTADDWVPTPYGMAIDYDGDGDWVVISDAPALQFGNTPFTIAALVNPNADHPGGSTLGILGRWTANTNNRDYLLAQGASNTYVFFISETGSGAVTVSSVQVGVIGQYDLVVGVYDGINITIYVNGLFGGSTAHTVGSCGSGCASDIKIGSYVGGGSGLDFEFNGKIGFSGLWNRAFSANEAKQLAQNPWAMFEPSRKTFRLPFWFVSGAVFKASGVATSMVMDMGGKVNWSDALKNQDGGSEDNDTSIDFTIRTSDDNITFTGYGAIGSAANSRFGQIKATLSSDPLQKFTPEFNDVRLQALLINAIMPVVVQNAFSNPVGLRSFTDTTRPSASGLPAGSVIWNSEDNAPNYSDGTDWRDAAGDVT